MICVSVPGISQAAPGQVLNMSSHPRILSPRAPSIWSPVREAVGVLDPVYK